MLRRLLGFLRIGPDGFEPSPPVPKTPNEPEEKAERRSRTRRPNRSVRVDSSRKPAQPVPNLHVNLHADGPGADPGPVRFSENRTPLERLETMLRRLAEEGPSVYRAALVRTRSPAPSTAGGRPWTPRAARWRTAMPERIDRVGRLARLPIDPLTVARLHLVTADMAEIRARLVAKGILPELSERIDRWCRANVQALAEIDPDGHRAVARAYTRQEDRDA